jgi:hypothetical protein
MRLAVKTMVAVGVGGTVARAGASRKEGVAGTKVGSTTGWGCEVGFGAANKAGSDEEGPDKVGTIFNDAQVRYSSPANRKT